MELRRWRDFVSLIEKIGFNKGKKLAGHMASDIKNSNIMNSNIMISNIMMSNMKKFKIIGRFFAALIFLTVMVFSMVIAENSFAGTRLRYGSHHGYFATPKVPVAQTAGQTGSRSGERLPAIILIHDWWGLDQQVKIDADRLAEKNFAVLAVDLFNEKTTKDAADANRLRDHLDSVDAMKNLVSALETLQKNPKIDKNHIGVLGYGVGADQGLKLAISSKAIKAVALFYGSPTQLPTELKNINGSVFAAFASDDKSQSVNISKEFDTALTEAHVEHTIKLYPGSKRGFADSLRYDSFNPNTGPEATKHATDFLTRTLQLRY